MILSLSAVRSAKLSSITQMPLSVGAKLGPYESLAPIGAGGMGEVYRARDTNLDRDVAVKVLPASLAQDPDRLARFKREAKVLASLNHPHIAQIYDVEDAALIMELVAGEAPKGPLSVETALHYASQIAEALEAAHEKGIVHRDLKPANIKVTPDGLVKVLDFGLATVEHDSVSDADPTKSPTMTLAATQAGTILGTAAYMSPEQAAGRPADKRADIWSFGVVLFELLAGHRLFQGETVSHTLAGVLAGLIHFDQLPRETPAAIQVLLRRCLERNPKNRLRDIGEARIAIQAAFQSMEPAAPAPRSPSPFAWIAAVVVFALAFGALAFVHFRETPAQGQRVRFQIDPKEGPLNGFSLSPDGRFLAIVTVEGSTTQKIWIRSLDGLETRLLTDVEGLGNSTLFWSWDGEQMAFQSGDKLYKIARIGGPPVVLASVPQQIQGGVWLDGGVILLGTAGGLFRVSSSGGAPVKIDDQSVESPAWLPGGRFLYVRSDGIFVGSLQGGKPTKVLADRTASTYVLPLKAGLPGHLLFVRGETLLAQPFNTDKPELQGEAIPVDACAAKMGQRGFTASTNGVLVCRSGNPGDVILTWLDRAGKRLRSIGGPFSQSGNAAIRLSPNDSQAIVPIVGVSGTDLWIADLNRETRSRFTFDGSSSGIWSPDGRKVLWASNDGNRYLKSADGSGKDEMLYKNANCKSCYPTDWSSDGKFITFAETGKAAPLDLWLVQLEGDRKPYPYLQSRFATYLGPDIARQSLDGVRVRPNPSSAASLRRIDPCGKGKLANLHGGRGLADLESRWQRTVLSSGHQANVGSDPADRDNGRKREAASAF